MSENIENKLLSQKGVSDPEMNDKDIAIEHNELFRSRTFKEELTKRQQLDDWMWYQSQKDFDEHSYLAAPCLHPSGEEPSFICKFVRLFCFSAVMIDWAVTIHNCPSVLHFFKCFKFFTFWGKIVTLITFTSGLYVMFLRKKPEKEVSDKDYDKHSIFYSWKWFIFFYEVALVVETLVSLFFWLLLYKDMMKNPRYQIPIKYFEMVLDHILIVFLLLDYFFNTVPFLRRHLKLMIPIGVSYLLLNFSVTKFQGRPIYGVMSWDSWVSVVVVIVTIFVSFLIFFFFEWATTKKLAYYATKK